MYKMRMRLSVDVDIIADDSNQAFQTLEEIKRYLSSAAELNNEFPNARVVNVFTDAMLKEETITQ